MGTISDSVVGASIPAGHAGNLYCRMFFAAKGCPTLRINSSELASLTGYSARSIWRYLSVLTESGILTRLRSIKGGDRGGSEYRFNVPYAVNFNVPEARSDMPADDSHLSNNSRSLRTTTPSLKASSKEKVNTETSSIVASPDVTMNVPLGIAGQELLHRIFGEIKAGRKTWDMGRESATLWDEVFTTGGVRAAQRLIADVVNYQTDGAQSFDDPFWPRVGVTVKDFGKSALKGYLVALGKGLRDEGLHNYAFAVAKKTAEQVYAEHGNGRKEHLRIVEAR